MIPRAAPNQIGLRERVLGGLIGCAVGDALGAPYEGLWPELAHLTDGVLRSEKLHALAARYHAFIVSCGR